MYIFIITIHLTKMSLKNKSYINKSDGTCRCRLYSNTNMSKILNKIKSVIYLFIILNVGREPMVGVVP